MQSYLPPEIRYLSILTNLNIKITIYLLYQMKNENKCLAIDTTVIK